MSGGYADSCTDLCTLHRTEIPVVRGLVYVGYKVNEYDRVHAWRIKLASLFIQGITFFVFALSFIVYNPENWFGENRFVAENTKTVIASDFQGPECTALGVYATSGGPFTNIISTLTEGVDYTLSASSDPSVELRFLVKQTIRITGDPQQCASFFGGVVSQFADDTIATLPYNCSFFEICSVVTEDAFVRLTWDNSLGDFTVETLNRDSFIEKILTHLCALDGSGFLLAGAIAPFSCTFTIHRGFLETIALSFGNGGFVYAIFVVLLFYLIRVKPRDFNDTKDMKV